LYCLHLLLFLFLIFAVYASCGAGSWLFELGTEFPSANFIGIDFSPIIPTAIKPHNVSFVQGDILDGLPFEDDTFDFVHQRILFAAFSLDKWQSVINDMVRVLKPGGYLEVFGNIKIA
jgi:ubiquinone/menaquinone biosynthesis C-methylase UbiE